MNPYAAQLGDQDPVHVLEQTPSRLRKLADSLGEKRLRQPLAPGKWSPREVFAHLADCEIVFGFRYRQALAKDDYLVQPFDQDQWAKSYAAYSAEEALSTFAGLRNWNLSLIRSLTVDQLRRPVRHPERGAETIGTLIEISAGHDLNHLERLEAVSTEAAR
jgi:hypothetical protein